MPAYTAIDFGTSNSAVFVGGDRTDTLVSLEQGKHTMPTAVFFNAEERSIVFGRQAIAEYQAAYPGRLMRSLKSLLGSELMRETTLINGKAVAYKDILAHFLSHLKQVAEQQCGQELQQLVLGRPVFFVDDDPVRDADAESTLADIAKSVGYSEVQFQYEPIAAALDFESQLTRETLVLVADIGGGTSDFSLIRLGPERAKLKDRSADVLANGGVHIAGTDFDQQLSLATVMPTLGLGGITRNGKPIPAHLYFELATWHRINLLYVPQTLAAAEAMRTIFKDERAHTRLMRVLREREGHRLAGEVEAAKVTVAETGTAEIDLGFVEEALSASLDAAQLQQALAASLRKIAEAAQCTVRDAGVAPQAVEALYFTGGSTGLAGLRAAIAEGFPNARIVIGEQFASVAKGLGVHAHKLFAS
ncbi:MAG: Hsp70 family protein [Stagnimonas sp.]|nr:Hsp70 family protein [Stagnimonas sp.]